METPELSQSAATQRNEEPELVEADTAFLVIRTKEGNYMLSLDINMPLTIEDQAAQQDVEAALRSILDDLNNQKIAQLTAQHLFVMQMQMAAKVQEQRTNQEIISKLPGGLAR